MEHWILEITLLSAKGLKKVGLMGKMDVYAVVSICGGYRDARQRTPVDKDGDTSPSWNFPMKFCVDGAGAQQNHLTLVITLKSQGVLGDKNIGEVHVPVKELLDGVESGDGYKSATFVSYQVRKPSGKPKGELSFSYKFGERVAGNPLAAKADEPVTAYPPPIGASYGYLPPQVYPAMPPSGGSYPPPGGYHPAPAAYAYNQAPPPPSYAYNQAPPLPAYAGYPPPPQLGYGYPQQPPKKNGLGLGLGAGLLGGALGGLLIGDIVSDGGG